MPYKNPEDAKRRAHQYYLKNKEHWQERNRIYYRLWQTPERRRRYLLKWRYGLTEQVYQELLNAQDGKCAICDSMPGKRRLHVDHCHKTGTIRGLLCDACNLGIGKFQENIELLEKATNYLKRIKVRSEVL